ncbi:MAG: ASKHA domain-containing protein [Candidatus Hadarchaeales archaeon]
MERGELFFRNYGKKVKLERGRSLLSYCQELGIELPSLCGGIGVCGQCLLKVEGEGLNPLTEAELKFVKPGERLACQARVEEEEGRIIVEVPERRYKILEKGRILPVRLEPAVRREGREVVWEWKEERRKMGEYEGEIVGLALDVGTTTLVAYAVDLETGRILGVTSMKNPQEVYGGDVISRIAYARKEGQRELEEAVRRAVNIMVERLGVKPEHVYEMVVVGNSTMRDLFLGHPVASLGVFPFQPFTLEAQNRKPTELGLKMNPMGNVYALPLIGGFVGADTVAGILATDLHRKEEIGLLVDIGTNTEIVVGNRERMISTSCASGPAFEGSGIKCGVGAISGAISRVEMDGSGRVAYETIDDLPPVGLCGSALIDVLAEMLNKGFMDETGKFTGGRKEVVIAKGEREIKIDEEDVDKLKLAKAAICVGTKVLLEKYGIGVEEVEKVYLAGAFGTYIRVENAYAIGLLPSVPLDKVEKVGNSALEGARQALVSKGRRREGEEVARRVEYLNLESESDLMYRLVGELSFSPCV